MKIKFLKDSPGGTYKKGETYNINDWRANYFVKTGQAEKAPEKKERKAPAKKEDKNAAPETESKSKK
tara:strand:- start:1541 stop:1741 length:201 start_codon:yes stop_codon:yes gene_type:complete